MDARNHYRIFTTLASHGILYNLSNSARAMIYTKYTYEHMLNYVYVYEKLWSTYKSS